MLAGPGFRPITRTAQKHEGTRLSRRYIRIADDLIGHAMIYLEIARLVRRMANGAYSAVIVYEQIFEQLGERFPAAEPSGLYLREIAEPICGDCPSGRIYHMKGFEWDTLLSHISCGARRMIIAILGLKFFGGDVSVLQDMFDNDLWSLASHRPQ
jgi:hypothetical protein